MKKTTLNQEVVNYAKEAADAGFSREDIKVSLVNLSYHPEEIKAALIEADRLAHTMPQSGPAVPQVPNIQAQPQVLRPPVMPKPNTAPMPVAAQKVKKKDYLAKSKFYIIASVIVFLMVAAVAAVLAYDAYVLVLEDFDQLLPEETQWYLVINTDTESDQNKKLQAVINKFPLVEDIKDFFEKAWADGISQELRTKGLDKYFSFIAEADEIMLAQVLPVDNQQNVFDLDLNELHIAFIAKSFNSAKQKVFIEYLLSDSDLVVTTEEYRKDTIYSIEEKIKEVEYDVSAPPLKAYFVFIEDFAVLGNKKTDLFAMIDLAANQSILGMINFDKKRCLSQNDHYQRIKENITDEYLMAAYGSNIDLNQELNKTSRNQLEFSISSLLKKSSLKASLVSPALSLDGSSINLISDVLSSQVVRMTEKGLSIESYLLDLKTGQEKSDSFSLSDSLANILPEKLNGRWVDFFGEGRNLKKTIDLAKQALSQIDQELQDSLIESGSAQDEEEVREEIAFFGQFFDDLFISIDAYLGINLEKDLLAYAKGNFCYFSAPAFDGNGPENGLIIQVEQPDQVKANLEKMKLNDGVFFDMFDEMSLSISVYAPMFLTEKDTEWYSQDSPFEKTMYQGIDIYKSPLNSLLPINYAIKDDKLIVASSEAAIRDIIDSITNQSIATLINNQDFKAQFSDVNTEIEAMHYMYNYGFVGFINYLVSEGFKATSESMASMADYFEEDEYQQFLREMEETKNMTTNIVNDLIGPYLKTVKTSGSYFILEDGIEKNYQTIIIEEQLQEEKDKAKETWELLESMGFGDSYGF